MVAQFVSLSHSGEEREVNVFLHTSLLAGMECRALPVLGKCFTSEGHLHPLALFLLDAVMDAKATKKCIPQPALSNDTVYPMLHLSLFYKAIL